VSPPGSRTGVPVGPIAADEGAGRPQPDLVRQASSPELLKKKQRLAALVVHDLRNPLAALSGNLEILREELAGQPMSPIAVDSLADCLSLVAKVQSLCATILDVDELEDGVLRAQRAEVDIDALVRRSLALIARPIEARSLRIEIDVPGGLHAVVDPDLFARVIENLLDNSVRYAPRGGRLVVSAARVGGELILAIGNDGRPVSAPEREVIFTRYHQIEARRSHARAGRGLGLYFCRLAVEAHGGTIDVESRGDLGAVFVVTVPEP
jgi:two-component system, OmpR family, heavy metal sensor histidine kinase CusS